MSEGEQIDGFNGGLVEGWKFGGSLTPKFKESTSTTEVTLPNSIKLTMFSSRTRSFRVKLEFHDGFIEIPLSMERLEDWEKEIRRKTAECEKEEEEELEREKEENVDTNN
jgi:hypothetical protein